MATWDPIKGETPIDPSHLKDKSIKTRNQLNMVASYSKTDPDVIRVVTAGDAKQT